MQENDPENAEANRKKRQNKKQSGGKSKSRNCFCLLRRYAFGCSGLRVTGLNAQVTRRSFANACLCFLESLEAGTILFLLPMAAPPKTGFFYSIAEKTSGGKRFCGGSNFWHGSRCCFGGYTENTIAVIKMVSCAKMSFLFPKL